MTLKDLIPIKLNQLYFYLMVIIIIYYLTILQDLLHLIYDKLIKINI